MRVEVTVPEDYMGPVNGDLISRRGRLEGTEIRRRHAHHQGDGAAVGNVWLCDGSAFAARRAAAASPCTSGSTKKCRENIAEEIINRGRGGVATR